MAVIDVTTMIDERRFVGFTVTSSSSNTDLLDEYCLLSCSAIITKLINMCGKVVEILSLFI